jgi:hypothetical protein
MNPVTWRSTVTYGPANVTLVPIDVTLADESPLADGHREPLMVQP